MKKRRTLLLITVIAAAVLAVSMLIPTSLAKAADDEGYTYTVRIYAGKEGSFSGGESVLVYKDKKPGDKIAFDFGSVQLNNGNKYYVKGIRESGKDNYDPEHPQLSAITVTGDADYVVAYAMLGSSVAYTVNYVDANGNELSPSQTFYGNVDDNPVIAYRYVEGYFPQAYNLTKQLSGNAADNVFTFVYQSVAPREIQGEGTEEGAEGAGGAGAAMPGTGLNGGALPQNPEGTQELIDIDGGNVPMANGGENGNGSEGQGGSNGGNDVIPDNKPPQASHGSALPWILGGVGIAAAIAIIIAVIVAAMKRKKQD